MKLTRTLSSVVFATLLAGPLMSTAFAEITVNVVNRGSDDMITVSVRRADGGPNANWRKLGTVRGKESGNWTLQRAGTYEVQILDFKGQRRPPTDQITIRDGQTLRIRSSGEYDVRQQQ